jgi:predicted Fe-Mo cluster-binding NifX family protein
MKIVITAAAANADGEIDSRFGRAAMFVVYDTDTGSYSAHDNTQNLNAAQGAGIQAAQNVAALGAEWVITGHCGPKAFRVLTAGGIKIGLGAKGKVGDAVKKLLAGEIIPAESPDVEGHWV